MSKPTVYPFLKGFLSQWHPSNFHIGSMHFNCAEQYMMLRKALLFKDEIMAQKIMAAAHPSDHKRLGQQVRGFETNVWDAHKVGIVTEGNMAKFSQNAGLRKKLLATGDAILAEANPKDIIWGVGLSENDPKIDDVNAWRGENLLGYILMDIRSKLRLSS